jgi:hypothetical protein
MFKASLMRGFHVIVGMPVTTALHRFGGADIFDDPSGVSVAGARPWSSSLTTLAPSRPDLLDSLGDDLPFGAWPLHDRNPAQT